jgi:UDPglucose 6-dehydrogenase
MTERISVIGLGKLGLCLAACFSEKGFITIGIDINEKIVESINQKITPISEPGLDVLITRHGGLNPQT